jgi:YVTN family beta-propeller protein
MDELPSGAVTFLFTDIEGSTRLVKQLREQYANVLAEHQRLLRVAFSAHAGHEIDTQGDSFFVAFSRARDAVLAAVAGQRALLGNEWPDGIQVRVRMGIHTGQAVASDGRYTGLAVHRAARIGAAGHGGQVLLSQATQTLLEDEEEDLQISLRDLGEKRLKDLDRPVRLYQAVAPELPAEFPPVREVGEHGLTGWRRPRALIALGLTLVAAVAAAVVLATRSSGSSVTVAPNSVGLIDLKTNKVVGQVPVGSQPGPVADGGSSIWVANTDERTLSRIDAQSHEVHGVPLSETPTGIAVGAGAVWVANGRLGGLTRVDQEFGSQTTLHRLAGILTGESRDGSVAVGNNSVWVAYGASAVVRVRPGIQPRVLARSYAGRSPSGISVGEGSIWVSNSGDNSISQFDPDTFAAGPVHKVSVGRRPSAIATGGGYVWVANALDATVGRYDPNSSDYRTIDGIGKGPVGIAYGSGAVWVANSGDGTVSRIDPTTGKITSIHVGNSPQGVAVGDGLVWVTVQGA